MSNTRGEGPAQDPGQAAAERAAELRLRRDRLQRGIGLTEDDVSAQRAALARARERDRAAHRRAATAHTQAADRHLAAAGVHARSAEQEIGDVAHHREMEQYHRAAAEADRQAAQDELDALT
ncbi:hypothetical protein [Nakamurella leprariae]|uniref:Uncharacterized protein n=1 Tax=Nakamurella leprariae TaxID=2803911 RepID=A0A938YE85_9ACTN|nr:hypothetical protein [Nakamurella leprariae]MBM9469097.1 hypothetical protein [Nakamurella leprariae]